MKRDPYQRLWMKKETYEAHVYSSTTPGMGLFFFIHNLWNRSLFIHPQPLV
jgi:hypothetical protein